MDSFIKDRYPFWCWHNYWVWCEISHCCRSVWA